ncbi:hypothetical protein I316_06626 [Kwoniella heveanensis BCC8398]|uniref:Elongin-A n=1 Tax=Kwoniella heveanensis BCC8398 TaxID=1296120 RepID=A0A1B9GL02_9TREE|nr:hypothetical protein I316_06626 [Kwoniella heveanensis BCC8398]
MPITDNDNVEAPSRSRALEYEEEDDLFGSDTEVNSAAPVQSGSRSGESGSSASRSNRINPAQPINPVPRHDSTQTQTSSFNQAGSSAKKGKGKATATGHPETSGAAPVSTGKVYKDVDTRLRELQDRKRLEKEEHVRQEPALVLLRGVKSLKGICIEVLKTYSSRIEDIGDLEYAIVKPFIDDLPMEQLSAIESASPHIKTDTDWLWEIFLLQQFPLYHERCQDRRGEMRTSGWRKMYKKAKEDLDERREQAVANMSARYREMEKIKASKSIVVMDKLMPDKKRAKSGWGSGAAVRAPTPQGPLAKARVEAQRARVALTHASGKYIPPPPTRASTSASAASSQLFKNPYLASTSSPASASSSRFSSSPYSSGSGTGTGTGTGSGPGRPRVVPKPDVAPHPSYLPKPIKAPAGTGLSPRFVTGASAKPASIPVSASTHASTSSTDDRMDRFRIGGPGSTPKFRQIRKPDHPKFEIPALDKDQQDASSNKANIMDFFGPKPSRKPNTDTDTSGRRSPSVTTPKIPLKRKSSPSHDEHIQSGRYLSNGSGGSVESSSPTTTKHDMQPSPASAIVDLTTCHSPTRKVKTEHQSTQPQSQSTHPTYTPVNTGTALKGDDATKRMESVLFRKKRAARPSGGR